MDNNQALVSLPYKNHIITLNTKKDLLQQGRFSSTFKCITPEGALIIKQYKPKKNNHPFETHRFKQQKIITELLYPELDADIVEIHNEIYFIRKYIEGYPLKIPIKKVDIKTILISILDELKRLHNLNYLHTDIKPTNILINNEKIYLTDFGNCIKINSELPDDYIIPFTMIYAPPEMILNRYDLCNYSSDIYMWGMLAYHATTGTPPFSHCNPVQLMHIQLNARPEYNLIRDEKWRKVIIKATQIEAFKRPPNYYTSNEITHTLKVGISKRYQSVDEVLNDLK